MKKRSFFAGLLLAAYVLSGCGASSASVQSGAQPPPVQRLTPAADDGIYTEPEGFADRQPGRTYGEVVTVSYPDARGASRTAKVALPAGYHESTSYPVVYLLHGIHATVDTWIGMDAPVIAENLYAEGKAKQMILVSVDSFLLPGVEESTAGLKDLVTGYDNIEGDLIGYLMPYIESHFSAAKGRGSTAIAGFSMGGREALGIAFRHPELFGYIGGFSSASGVVKSTGHTDFPSLINDFTIDEAYGGFGAIVLDVGISDDVCKDASYEYADRLTANGFQPVFYDREGGHEGIIWQSGFYQFARRIFA